MITQGAFDSQNLAFWDPVRKEYRAYWRIFTAGVADGKTWKPAGIRAIRTATSKDLLNWAAQADLQYVDSPAQHLYTNQIQPYYRAPHIFMGFPMRYTDRGWSESMMALPGLEERLARAKASPRYGTAITDGLFMTSRDGVLFHRWNEAFLRPGPRQQGSWVYGDNLIFWGMVETASALGDAPNDLSLYAPENYWQGTGVSFRRLTLRIDGFVSLCGSRPRRRAGHQTAGVRRRQPDAQRVDLRRGKHPGRDPGRRGPAHRRLCPGRLPGDLRRRAARTSCVGAREATCGRCPARRSGCGSCSRTPISTPSSSCPTSPTRSAPSPAPRAAKPKKAAKTKG